MLARTFFSPFAFPALSRAHCRQLGEGRQQANIPTHCPCRHKKWGNHCRRSSGAPHAPYIPLLPLSPAMHLPSSVCPSVGLCCWRHMSRVCLSPGVNPGSQMAINEPEQTTPSPLPLIYRKDREGRYQNTVPLGVTANGDHPIISQWENDPGTRTHCIGTKKLCPPRATCSPQDMGLDVTTPCSPVRHGAASFQRHLIISAQLFPCSQTSLLLSYATCQLLEIIAVN